MPYGCGLGQAQSSEPKSELEGYSSTLTTRIRAARVWRSAKGRWCANRSLSGCCDGLSQSSVSPAWPQLAAETRVSPRKQLGLSLAAANCRRFCQLSWRRRRLIAGSSPMMPLNRIFKSASRIAKLRKSEYTLASRRRLLPMLTARRAQKAAKTTIESRPPAADLASISWPAELPEIAANLKLERQQQLAVAVVVCVAPNS